MSKNDFVRCPNCDTLYRIPQVNKTLKITCQSCNTLFFRHKKKINKNLIIGTVLIIIFTLFIINTFTKSVSSNSFTNVFSSLKTSNWITISYDQFVDKSIITHSGNSIAEVIRDITTYTDDKGLVQEYLEPYSKLCNNYIQKNDVASVQLRNILDHYPIGSEQPAWVDLFREGHFQIYYNNSLIRLFLKGSDPIGSFNEFQSVVRHPINDITHSNDMSIKNIEIYVFSNDYSKLEIQLNTIPKIVNIDEINLSARYKSIDLESIETFLNQGVILEAVEVDENNDLYFYGQSSKRKTIAGIPISISDLAVIYRAIFHYGNNAPYISLDKHEDNRYAKINFGGNLANTRVGSVVLEADKLFKTLSTGLDPNTHQLVKSKITNRVPNFLTEDERSLIENEEKVSMQIRYWFYPDSIGTVTDGNIGAVLTNQFLAEVERMDTKFKPSKAVKNTIDHLNRNYEKYENVIRTFEELSTVGRIMALVNWLKGMNMNERIELDELLSVKIPSFTTPKKTKKMLALTVAAYSNNTQLTLRNIRDYSKVYYISDLLDNYNSSYSDKNFLDIAKKYADQLNINELAPNNYKELNATINYYGKLIKNNELQISILSDELERENSTLDSYNAYAINRYNEKVNRYNVLIKNNEALVNAYNNKINKLNEYKLSKHYIYSIGGGINLRPKEFKKIIKTKNAPKLVLINRLKSKLKTVGKIAKIDNWIRSNPKSGGSRTNLLPFNTLSP